MDAACALEMKGRWTSGSRHGASASVSPVATMDDLDGEAATAADTDEDDSDGNLLGFFD